MIDAFYDALLNRIREQLSECSRRCLDGSFTKIEEYKYANGCIRGLELADDIIRETYAQALGGSYIKKDVVKNAGSFQLYSSP